jgi:hypothetical protein
MRHRGGKSFSSMFAAVVLTLSALLEGTLVVAAAAVASSSSPGAGLLFAAAADKDHPAAGASASRVILGSPLDPCYDENDRAHRCIPPFVNAAYGRQVVASSTCGNPATRLPASLLQAIGGDRVAATSSGRSASCKRNRRRSGGGGGGASAPRRRWDCDGTEDAGDLGESDDDQASMCDASDPTRRYTTFFLTDLNNPSNRTCWVSAPIQEHNTDKKDFTDHSDDDDDEGDAVGDGQRVSVSEAEDEVSLTLSLGKKYEVNRYFWWCVN